MASAMKGSEAERARRRRRRVKIALLAGGVLVLLLLVTPSVLVRVVLARSAFGRFRPTFESAWLNPLGGITLQHLVLHDTGEQSGEVLLSAGRARVTFSWLHVFGGKWETVELEEVKAEARGGTAGPVTLLGLGGAGGGGGGGGGAGELPFEDLDVRGEIEVQKLGAWAHAMGLEPGDVMGVSVHAAMSPISGSAGGKLWDVSVLLGDPDHPDLTDAVIGARAHITTSGRETRIHVDSLTLENVSAALSGPMMAALTHGRLDQGVAGHLDRLEMAGTAVLSGAGPAVADAAIDFRDVSLKGAGDWPLSVDRLSFTTRVHGPLTADPLRDLVFTRSSCTFDGAEIGGFRMTRAGADVNIAPSEIGFSDLHGFVGDAAEVHASAAWDIVHNIPSRADVDLRFVNLATLHARLPEGLAVMVPPMDSGRMDARLFITDAEPGRVVAHVDVAAPGATAVRVRDLPAAWGLLLPLRGEESSLSAASINGGATVEWTGRFGDSPSVTGGHLEVGPVTAAVAGEAAEALFSKVTADLAWTRGFARLDDLTLTFAGGGQASGFARYDLAHHTLASAAATLSGVDLRSLGPWFPAGTELGGKLDVTLRYNGLGEIAILEAGLSGAPRVRLPAGEFSLAGPAAVSVHAMPTAEAVRVDAATFRGPATMVVDGATLFDAAPRVERFGLGSLLEDFRSGATVSLERLRTSGRFERASGVYEGEVAAGGLALRASALPGRSAGLVRVERGAGAVRVPVRRPLDGEAALGDAGEDWVARFFGGRERMSGHRLAAGLLEALGISPRR